jgi:ribosome-associated protein
MLITMMENQRRQVLSLHLSIVAYLLSVLLLLNRHNQDQSESVSCTVHAFIAASTNSRVGIPSRQMQFQRMLVPILSPKAFLTLSLSDHLNGNNDNSTGSSKIKSVAQQSKRQATERALSNQQGKREMFNSIMAQPPSYSEGDTVLDINSNIIPIIDDSTHELINCIVVAADGRKADNIVALYVAHMTTMTSVLVVVSGNSRPQNQAICAAIRSAVSEINAKHASNSDNHDDANKIIYQQPSIEGTAESGWMILDYGSVMVHVMTPKSRLFYNVEGKWKQPQPMISSPDRNTAPSSATVMTTAIPLDLSNLLVPNTATVALNSLQQQREPRMYDGSDEGSMIPNTIIENDYETAKDELEGEAEEELDPFWS